MSLSGANKLELVQIAESVAQEKMIDRSLVIEAIEEALSKAAHMKYGADRDIRVSIDPNTGQQTVKRVQTVVTNVENDKTEISLKDAQAANLNVEIGEEIIEELEAFDIGRNVAQSAKQILIQKVREAERERQYEEFKDRVGTLIVGTVKREEYGHIIVDLTRGEGILRRDQKIGRESYTNGERIRAYVKDVRKEARGPQIFLSRSANEFMIELFRNEVPEIYEGTIEIRSVARDPGSRAKIAVASYESSIDPVGSCVGMRGSRVQTVVNELQGERIDVIPWTDNPVNYIASALQPANVAKVKLDPVTNIPQQAVVPDDQLSLAIGRGGQNIRLARALTGYNISVITESKEEEIRQAADARLTEDLMEAIQIDQTFAQYLVAVGIETVEYLANCDLEELQRLEAIDEETAELIKQRALEYIDAENKRLVQQAKELGMQQDLVEFERLSPKMLLALVSAEKDKKVASLNDLAACDMYELVGEYVNKNGKRVWESGILEDYGLSLEEARVIIIEARILTGIMEADEANKLLNEPSEQMQNI